jgi:hypothetical protein
VKSLPLNTGGQVGDVVSPPQPFFYVVLGVGWMNWMNLVWNSGKVIYLSPTTASLNSARMLTSY